MRAILFFGLAAALAGPAAAQTKPAGPVAAGLPLESVTVTDSRQVPDAVIAGFVDSVTSPSHAGKIARWNQGVCPKTTGLAAKFTDYISGRIRDVAAKSGAPVDGGASCKPNIHVIFIDQPQDLLDGLRKKSPAYFGYFDSDAQLDNLTRFKPPLQSWYATQTRDAQGATHFDSRDSGGEVEIPIFCVPQKGMPPECTSTNTIRIPKADAFAVTGGRLADGLSSELFHVLIVAEPARLKDAEIGALADYIAMLALSQIAIPDVCRALPSILNLMAPDCPQKPGALTAGDVAFLRGLYKMTGAANLRGQRDQVAYQMRQSLAGPKK
jgi:hypothetical protein